jgi:hypothetical protein
LPSTLLAALLPSLLAALAGLLGLLAGWLGLSTLLLLSTLRLSALLLATALLLLATALLLLLGASHVFFLLPIHGILLRARCPIRQLITAWWRSGALPGQLPSKSAR